MTFTVKDIDQLLKVCDAATPGPWQESEQYVEVLDSGGTKVVCYVAVGAETMQPNMDYIVALNPDTVHRLLVEFKGTLEDNEVFQEMCPGADGIQKQVRLAGDIEALKSEKEQLEVRLEESRCTSQVWFQRYHEDHKLSGEDPPEHSLSEYIKGLQSENARLHRNLKECRDASVEIESKYLPLQKLQEENDQLKEEVKKWERAACLASMDVNQQGSCMVENRNLKAWVEHLKGVIERDRSDVSNGIMLMLDVIASCEWMADGRGNYEYDDERYQGEFGEALKRIRQALVPLEKIGSNLASCPETQRQALLERRTREELCAQLKEKTSELSDIKEKWESVPDEYQNWGDFGQSLLDANDRLSYRAVERGMERDALKARLEAKTKSTECCDDCKGCKCRSLEDER